MNEGTAWDMFIELVEKSRLDGTIPVAVVALPVAGREGDDSMKANAAEPVVLWTSTFDRPALRAHVLAIAAASHLDDCKGFIVDDSIEGPQGTPIKFP